MKPETTNHGDPTRRRILQLGLAGVGAAAIGPVGRLGAAVRPTAATEPFVVIVNLRGGNDGLNTVIPITLARYADRRPALALDGSTSLSLDAGPNATTMYGLHPALDGVAGLWADGDLGIVQRVGYPDPNRSHFESEDIWSHGVRGSFGPLSIPESGWIARWAELDAPESVGAVSIGMGRPASFVGGTTNPLLVQRLDRFAFEIDYRNRNNHQHRLEIVQKMLRENAQQGLATRNRAALLQSHDLATVCADAVASYQSEVAYPATSTGQRFRDIAIMLQAGFATRLFYTGMGGFDTHSGQGREAGRHALLLGELDDALVAFADDMKALGAWQNCAIVVISEFGRRCYENGSGGTDHGAANCVLLAGGAVRGGLHGPDLTDADLDHDDLPYAVDYRSIYKCILGDHLRSTAMAQVFPEAQPIDDTLSLIA